MTTLQRDQQLARIDRLAKVLIIGVIPGNLGVELERHPRVQFGTAEDYERKTVMLPETVGRVFLTRYCSHKITDRIRPLAAKQGVHVVFHHEGGMGALRKAVWESLGESPSGRTGPVQTVVAQALKTMTFVAAPPASAEAQIAAAANTERRPLPDAFHYRTLADFLDARWDWSDAGQLAKQAARLKADAERSLSKQWADKTFYNTVAKWYADRLERRTRPGAVTAQSLDAPFVKLGLQPVVPASAPAPAIDDQSFLPPEARWSPAKLAVRSVETVRKMEATITLAQLREAFGIPENASVTVRVPGGADWSNTDLDIEDHPIEITWEERS